MSSSVQGKPDAHLRLVSDEDAIAIPENARPNDESPTVISKSPPLLQPISSNKDKITELARRPVSAESIVEGLRGRKLAHFELIEPIGVGGMAAVIRARDTQLDRFVALKILPPDMALQTDNVQRFHQEAKAAAKLDHENIARVFFCGEDQGLHFIAFEFVEGVNLRTMLERRGRIPVAEAVRYILQVATGLEHATTRGVVHRDVKPSNIIITPDGRAKLVDMGLARNLERRGEADLTHSGMTLGTFDYISPEQALEPREADARSDIYSLGCTFYHMLTGQSPVPEGTPAKKLHHHQHLEPLDPRDIDPTIPIEIVMILSKMMAKSPKDRYQRPIHLVQNLLPLAKKLGIADDVPEGMLIVDAPLPTQPESRPLLMIGLALAALVAVIFVLSLAPTPPMNTTKIVVPTKGVDPVNPQPGPKPSAVAAKQEGPIQATAPGEVRGIENLRTVLKDHETSDIVATLNANAPIDLDGTPFKGRAGQRLTLKSDDAGSNVLRFEYKNAGPPIGLSLEGADEVVFHKIKFQNDSSTAPNQNAVAPIAVRGVKRVRFEYCIFTQPNAQKIPSEKVKRVPFASLLIDASDDPNQVRPEVILQNCAFEGSKENGGQVAVAINGPASVRVTNTAFRPHSAFFSFRDQCTRAQTSLRMEYSTGFVYNGPVIRFSKDASADVRLAHDAFIGSPSGVTLPGGLAAAGLLYLAGEKPIRLDSRENLYYSLNSFIEKPGDPIIAKQEDYQKALAKMKCADEESTFRDGASPLQNANALADSTPLAFQLTAEFAAPFGLRTDWMGQAMPVAPVAVVKTPLPAPKTKIVDAERGGKEPGYYRTLAAALSEAADGDTILLRVREDEESREIVVTPGTLKNGINLTIKPFDRNHRPILVLDQDRLDRELAMFNVQAGSLLLQNLELRLDPSKSGYDAQSLVQLGEAAQCTFKSCVFTLRRVTKAQLNVVTFADLDMGTMMKSDLPNAGARAEFRECFVRGKGDLVSVRGCRPLQVEIEDSLIALAGQLLDTEAINKSMSAEKPMMSFKMARSSLFTTESAFMLKSKTGKGLAKTEFKVEGCLLAALSPDEPIVSLMLYDTQEENVADYLTWEGSKNFYANFNKMRMWEDQFKEMSSKYDKLALPKITDMLKQSLWEATPDLFNPTDPELGSQLKGFGLQVTPEIEQRWLPPSDFER